MTSAADIRFVSFSKILSISETDGPRKSEIGIGEALTFKQMLMFLCYESVLVQFSREVEQTRTSPLQYANH